MSEQMQFPETWEEFIMDYAFVDTEEIYTNGSSLVPTFRVKQMMDHYYKKETEWVLCGDRLPENHDWVLVSTKMVPEGYCGVPHIAELRHGVWYCDSCDGPMEETLSLKVTAWMPLPEPYNEVRLVMSIEEKEKIFKAADGCGCDREAVIEFLENLIVML